MFEDLNSWPEFAALMADLEGHAATLRQEALGLLEAAEGGFKPWHEPQIYEGGWEVYGLFWNGREVERRTRAPLSKEILGAWQPVVFNAGFSAMLPGVQIKPHVGYTADVLRLHLALVVPECESDKIGIRVGNQIRGWEAGKCHLFDDTQEHEAWNKSTATRVVLLVDLLRPAGREKGVVR